MSNTYLHRGVSPSKEEVHDALERVDAGLFPGAFCKLVEDLDGEHVAALHADGAGTKSLLAYLDYKEHDRATAFEGIAQDSAVMNIDDLLCVGAVDAFLLSNTIGRNAHRVDGSVIKAIIGGYERFARLMRAHGMAVVTAGGETADLGDIVQTVLVDSTVYCRLRREDVVDCSRIRPGNVIVGMSSSGRATYEDSDNSGIGSNGFTLARHVLLHSSYGEKYPETFSPTISAEHVYGGRFRMEDPLPDSDMTVGQALLSPTRTYAPVVRDLLASHREQLSGLIHCTGGGQAKCLHFGQGLHYIKNNLIPTPPIFRAIQAEGGVDWREMYQVFNMGQRLEAYCDPSAADAIVELVRGFGIDAQVVGEVRESPTPGKNKLTIQTDGRELEY